MSAPRTLVWSVGGNFVNLFVSMVSTVILGRLLSPTDFGAFAFGITIYGMVQWLLQTGMSTYVLREREISTAKLNTAYAVTSFQGIAATLIIMVLSPVAGWFAHSTTVGWVTFLVALMPALSGPESMLDGLWLRDGRFRAYSGLMIGKTAAQTIVSVIAQVWLHWGVYALVAGLLAYGLLSLIVAVPTLAWHYRIRPGRHAEHWAEVRSFGSRNLLLVLGQTGSMRVPDLIIGRELSIATLGYYNRATATIDMISRTLQTSIARALVPSFYRRVNEGSPLDHEVRELCGGLIFLCWPAAAGMAVLAQPIVRLIYGPQWGIAGEVLPWLCLVFAIDAARTGGMEVLTVHDKLTQNAWLELAHALYAIVLMTIGSHFGLFQALWAKVADSAITALLYLAVMQRLGALRIDRWVGLYAWNGVLTIAAAVPPFLLMRHWAWPNELSIGRYALAILSSIICWLLAAALTRHPYYLHGEAIVRRRLRRASA
ncbi:O-antigen/teichoic acid export membrane protein [Sphingomonas vulcanisoli]|uniref:O-antigen/teichoic acid export membrane protein n=1 Tax=Sphingomonas vulcanisoli TaxID=1658060 RepID=A0ABX0TR33_9SPHN|nr:oligosaccharide flippase family protein [Sphingomonas vulcanisoli]NIJ07988.1 O-antigen/teichoic acid export membrane protein [Sphingomonas vulcanisoli]